MDYNNDEWVNNVYDINSDEVTNWSIGTYLRIKPPTKKNKGSNALNFLISTYS